ncbi:phage portal protein [Acetanaerobacterium elongatum]|uniref:Phage portal protein, SPP1 family n=1 Tax=Acetanaerobacterium elongatum TaxID=258515 RepID=A0A1G9Z0H1_9FIRM|nr:phage portal protein [Acetanaerobacterium elongatum]SDN14899.1 phage portal protein, SPP1 family [Acetanaerobacterium elongatum]
MELAVAKKVIEKALKDNDAFYKKAKTAQEYYDNDSAIMQHGAAAIAEVNKFLQEIGRNPLKSADNRIPTNWHRIITDQKVGYLFTYPPSFDTDNEAVNTSIMQTLGDDYEAIIKTLGTDATNAGRAWLHYWYDTGEDGKKTAFQYHFIDPTQVLPIYDTENIKLPLKTLVRTYQITDDKGDDYIRFEVWTDTEVSYFCRRASEADKSNITAETMLLDGAVIQKVLPHTYGEIPFIEFKNNAASTGDLQMYKRLIDAMDKLISGFANDVDDIQEIVWVIKNYAGETSDVFYDKDGKEVPRKIDLLQELKARKVLHVDGDGGVDKLTAEIPFEARTKLYEILEKQIYISAMAVNPNPERTGQATGTYIDFLYSLLELKSGLTETAFRAALGKLIKAILRYNGLDEKMQVQQTWTRNKPKVDTEVADMINNTPDEILSRRTKTKVHPLVEDYQEELKQIEKEAAVTEEPPLYPQQKLPGAAKKDEE